MAGEGCSVDELKMLENIFFIKEGKVKKKKYCLDMSGALCT